MFFPKAMSEIELIVPARDLVAVTKVLSGHGVFHQADSNYSSLSNTSGEINWQERAAGYAGLERRIQILQQTLSIDEDTFQSIREFEALGDLDAIHSTVDQIEDEIRNITDQLSAERKRLEQLESTLHQIEPVADVDINISALRNSRYLFSILGLMPSANVERMQTSLARVPNVFLNLRSDGGRSVVWLAGTRSNADVLERAARSAYLNPLSLPEEYQGVPAEIIQSIHKNIEDANRKISELQSALTQAAKSHREQLRTLLWDVHASRVMSEAVVRFGQLRYTYVVTGWVQSDNLQPLTERLKAASREILIETLPTTRSGHTSDIPVALQNSRFLRPFQMLVNTYARPRYGELDPTILLAITFPLLFGAMFGDMGQGLVLFALGWLLSSGKVPALKSMASLGGLIEICGISAAFFGVIYGSLFGFEDVSVFGENFHLWGVHLPFSPIHNILQILMVAIGAGVVLLILGFLIGIFNGIISREWGHLLFGHNGVAGFLLYLSILGIGATLFHILPIPPIVFIVLAILSALAVMFSEVFIHLVEGYRPLINGGIGTYIIQAAVELFEVVISFLSNTLSYVRVGAFAVAHGGLSAAIFILAELISPTKGFGYWVAIIIGNIFIIGFEGLIVGIQTMRLHYYEFLGKFFTGGGMRFEPLALTPTKEE